MKVKQGRGVGASVQTAEIDDNQVTNAKIASHTSTKLTGMTQALALSETMTSSKDGDVLIPNVDGQGNIGTEAKTFALVRATAITSGDIILTDKVTKEKLYIIDEDKFGIYFKSYKTGKVLFKIPNTETV